MVNNKTIAILVIASLVLTLGSTILSLNKLSSRTETRQEFTGTGYATGQVNLSITDNAECTVPYNVSFGTGTAPVTTNILSTEIANTAGFNDCDFTQNCSGILINNTGNVDLVVNISSSAGAAAFLGGPSVQASDFIFKTENGSTRSTTAQPGCQANGTLPQGNWTNVVTAASTMLCRNLTYTPSNRQIAVEYNATLRSDTPAGNKLATLTITCITAT